MKHYSEKKGVSSKTVVGARGKKAPSDADGSPKKGSLLATEKKNDSVTKDRKNKIVTNISEEEFNRQKSPLIGFSEGKEKETQSSKKSPHRNPKRTRKSVVQRAPEAAAPLTDMSDPGKNRRKVRESKNNELKEEFGRNDSIRSEDIQTRARKKLRSSYMGKHSTVNGAMPSDVAAKDKSIAKEKDYSLDNILKPNQGTLRSFRKAASSRQSMVLEMEEVGVRTRSQRRKGVFSSVNLVTEEDFLEFIYRRESAEQGLKGEKRDELEGSHHDVADDERTDSEEIGNKKLHAGSQDEEAGFNPDSGPGIRNTIDEMNDNTRALVVSSKRKIQDKKKQNIADKDLDSENWSLKDVIRWANAKDRKEAAEKTRTQNAVKSQEELELNYGNSTPTEERLHEHVDAEKVQKNLLKSPQVAFHVLDLPGTSQGYQPTSLAPQVQVGLDGKIVVNVDSLTVQAQQKEQYTRVVTERGRRVSTHSIARRISNERWNAEDTELFYKALSQFGTDFTLIAHLFPGRQRRHVKNKFTRESKRNLYRVNEALRQSETMNRDSYKDMIAMLKESGMSVGGSMEEPGPQDFERLADNSMTATT